MIVRCSSHRSRDKLLRLYPELKQYHLRNFFNDTSKGYYYIPNLDWRKVDDIKGITKARSQDLKDYSLAW
jgi:hypothetical protein